MIGIQNAGQAGEIYLQYSFMLNNKKKQPYFVPDSIKKGYESNRKHGPFSLEEKRSVFKMFVKQEIHFQVNVQTRAEWHGAN